MSAGRAGSDDATPGNGRRPFRAADVLTGRIDREGAAGRARPGGRSSGGRKQISAQLEPEQVRLLGELHARLNATATRRIEKSELVGLGIELLAAVLGAGAESPAAGGTGGGLDPAPDRGQDLRGAGRGQAGRDAADGSAGSGPFADADDLRTYLRTHVRGYAGRR